MREQVVFAALDVEVVGPDHAVGDFVLVRAVIAQGELTAFGDGGADGIEALARDACAGCRPDRAADGDDFLADSAGERGPISGFKVGDEMAERRGIGFAQVLDCRQKRAADRGCLVAREIDQRQGEGWFGIAPAVPGGGEGDRGVQVVAEAAVVVVSRAAGDAEFGGHGIRVRVAPGADLGVEPLQAGFRDRFGGKHPRPRRAVALVSRSQISWQECSSLSPDVPWPDEQIRRYDIAGRSTEGSAWCVSSARPPFIPFDEISPVGE